MGGQVTNEGEKQIFQNRRYCQLCLRSECKWCRVRLKYISGHRTHFKVFVNWFNS